eukprot:1114242_1
MSLKRKLSTEEDPNTASKKRKLMDNQQEDKEKQFCDPKSRSNDCGLMVQNDDTSGIDYTKYQTQKVEQLDIAGCVHKICYPPNTFDDEDNDISNDYKINLDFESLNTENVIKYPYKLDVFQKQSIIAIENNHNVLVSAHTSAGKTTVAEYAIAKALALNERVIYTSPIKALSNQKYRQLQERFIDVGLMTGDTSMNREASCLVMTTEILRNMLYRGAEIIREISWVIFDEIHYMKDPNRGVVWEETLILLPQQSRFVFLSATIPNSVEFAKWISKINTNPCHVVYTEMRPVPLQHYIFPSGGNGIYLCVDHKSNFKESNFQRALNSVKDKKDEDRKKKKKKTSKKQAHNKDIFKLIKMIMEREFDPCIVFAFSKKQVEELALSLSKLDFCDMNEKKLICRIFNNAISTLGDADKMLPQIQSLIHLLQRGIGIHHSGLLPILKEIVEILFGEGLIRVLFTTETFSMGVNFPAKTVIFADVQKWDGMNHRLLSSGEYIQMSGRAGRRGLDERGIVIMMVNDKLEPFDLQVMLKGKSDRLLSQFHVTYPMLIQLQRLEDVRATYIIHRSFMQFQTLEKIPALQHKLDKIQNNIETNYVFENELEIEEYFLYQKALNDLYIAMIDITNKPAHILPWLNPGRLLYIAQPMLNKVIGWSVCINYKKMSSKDLEILQHVHKNKKLSIDYIVDVLTQDNRIISVQLHHIQRLSGIRLSMDKFKNLSNQSRKSKLGLVLNECLARLDNKLQELHPIKHLNICDEELSTIYAKIETLKKKMESRDIDDEACVQYKEKCDFEVEIVTIKNQMTALQNNEHIQRKLNGMKRVLRRLKMIDNNIITMKGKVACEISCGDELILTELLFSNLLQGTTPQYMNGLMSCFVFDEVIKDCKINDDVNDENYKKLKEKIVQICEVQKDSKLDIDSKKYIDKFGFGLMDLAVSWSKGAPFSQIIKMTQVYEGSVIRVLKRLDELLAELIVCASLMGNEKLKQTFEKCRDKIKRDIVFSASLYL